MIERLKEEVETAQARLRKFSDRLMVEGNGFAKNARHQVHKVRTEGSERLYNFEVQALDWADEVLERAEDLPGVSKVKEPIERFVSQAREAVTALPIEDYATLNARNAAAAVRELDFVGLAKVSKYEAANKNRKTVFQAIAGRQAVLAKPPVDVL